MSYLYAVDLAPIAFLAVRAEGITCNE
jgi:hypothetical protein